MKARWPWFAVWMPVGLLLYTLVNGAGHIQVAYLVLGIPENTKECIFTLKTTEFIYSPWGFLILPVLAIFAFVSWKLCPQWSPSVRWMAGMLGFLLGVLFLLAQTVLLCPRGWKAGMPIMTDLRVCASQLWRPHFCRSVLEPLNWDNPSPAWKAQAPDISIFLEDADTSVRLSTVMVLARLGDKSVAPQVAKLLEDANPVIRQQAIWTLKALGNKSVAPQIAKLLDDPEPELRGFAAEALGQLSDKSMTPRIIRLLEDTDTFFVRMMAARALSALGDKSAVPWIVRLLEDTDTRVRKAAAEVLRTLSGETWPDDKLEDSAQAWWAQHRNDPEWKTQP